MKFWLRVLLMLCAACAPGTAENGMLRVRLWSQHPPPKLIISGDPYLAVRPCNGCAPLGTGPFTITATASSVEVCGSKYAKLLLSGSYRVQVDAPVRLAVPMEITAKHGVLLLTAQVPLEEYVADVLAGEAAGVRSPETLKAMAVAARTFAVHFRARHRAEGYDLCDSTHCQDLRISAVNDRARAAAVATEGELLWYQGSTVASYYHQSCGGTTEQGTENLSRHGPVLPYLRQQNDPWCQRKSSSEWQSEISKNDLSMALLASGVRAPRKLRSVSITSRSASGRVLTLRLVGESVSELPEGIFYTAVGRALGWNLIRSALYQVSDRGGSVVFSGRGSGHGVGLCQAGAMVMGEEGHDYREILAFYYPRTQLGINPLGLRWSTLSGDRVEMTTTRPEIDRALLALSERSLREAEQRSGIALEARATLRTYPTVAAYRDATGEPGWVAASTRGNVIRLQSLESLQRARVLDSVLRHEFLHLLVETRARADTPLWLREGLVLWLNESVPKLQHRFLTGERIDRMLRSPANQSELRAAYAAAEARVAMLVQKNGRAAVIGWLSGGLPAELLGR